MDRLQQNNKKKSLSVLNLQRWYSLYCSILCVEPEVVPLIKYSVYYTVLILRGGGEFFLFFLMHIMVVDAGVCDTCWDSVFVTGVSVFYCITLVINL